jgi:hypothetical protein
MVGLTLARPSSAVALLRSVDGLHSKWGGGVSYISAPDISDILFKHNPNEFLRQSLAYVCFRKKYCGAAWRELGCRSGEQPDAQDLKIHF